MKTFLSFAFATILFAASGTANGATISFMDTIVQQSTNWQENIELTQFDPNLGTLTGIMLTLEGTVNGTANYESLDNAPANISLDVSAGLTILRPDLTTLLSVTALVNQMDAARAFDSIIDFAGPSGGSFPGLTNTATTMASFNAAPDLILFTGLGTILLPTEAIGMSSGSGSGNLITQFTNSASAKATIKYTFDAAGPGPVVPEPGTMLLFGSGLAGLIGWRWKNRKTA